MTENINLRNFYIDKDGKCLHGKVKSPKFNLAGAKLFIPKYAEIKGCVVELFRVVDVNHVRDRAKGISFDIGDWYIMILINKGWSVFVNNKIKELILIEPEFKNAPETSSSSLGPNEILVKLKSEHRFSRFYLDLRGGSTNGVGRNEHGEPHFHIILYAQKKDIGKVFFPSISEFKNGKNELIFKTEISKKDRKEITEWVFESSLKNLELLNNDWNLFNKDNNRLIKRRPANN